MVPLHADFRHSQGAFSVSLNPTFRSPAHAADLDETLTSVCAEPAPDADTTDINVSADGDGTLDPSDGPEPPLQVIPVTSTVDAHGRPTLRVVDARSAAKKAEVLAAQPNVQLGVSTLTRLASSCVTLAELTPAHIKSQRVETGWLSMVEVREFVTLLGLTPSNDRLGDQLMYAADPAFTSLAMDTFGRPVGHIAVPMPTSEGTNAQIVYSATKATLLQATDRNCLAVQAENPQDDIGPDIIHRALTAVFTLLDYSGERGEEEQATADGNSRLGSAYARIEIIPEWLPTRLRKQYAVPAGERKKTVKLLPSMIMNCTFSERRDLTRKIIKANEERLAMPATGKAKDLRERNAAVCTLNALTAPVQVIVGYVDDDQATYGMSRFASAVRSLLVRMNVGVKAFDKGAQNAVKAEEIVLAARQNGHFDDTDTDLLIGRGDVTAAMEYHGLDPSLRDLRAAFVTRKCSEHAYWLNKAMREKNRAGKVTPVHRTGAASELALRSYTTKLSSTELDRARTALNSGCVWQDLISSPWHVTNVNSSEKIDELLKNALTELGVNQDGDTVTGKPGEHARLLGVLGLFALVIAGGLTSPKGSSEKEVNDAIDRSSVGSIVDKLLTFPWGLRLLAENIKRARANSPLLLAQVPDGETEIELVDDAAATVTVRDARLRQAVRIATQGRAEKTAASDEETAFTALCRHITQVDEAFRRYRAIRNEDPSPSLLPMVKTDTPIKQLEAIAKALNKMTVDEDQ
jgi:hypothetical protein